jgi:predicted ATPase/DNA-binding SARP family transcriptional activator
VSRRMQKTSLSLSLSLVTTVADQSAEWRARSAGGRRTVAPSALEYGWEAMRFGVLGPLAVWRADGTAIKVPDLKVRVLLAELLAGLLVQEERPVSVDRLAEALWRGRPPGNPLNTLQTKVSQLRRALEEAEPGGRDLVVYQPPGYLLRVGHDAVDAQRFRDLVTLAHETEDPQARAALLVEALGLWRGPALADFGEEAFARATIARLEEQQLTAQELYAEARLELGQHHLLADELAELVARNPLRERLRAAYMRALYRAGRQSEALATYGDLRDCLVRELGLDPSPELVALHLAILKQDAALARPPAPAPSTERLRTNLPAPLTELVGRAEAVTDVRRLLGPGRLVTLTGSGGVGKTRLAVETATQLVDRFPDGVWLVELAGLGRPGEQDATGSLAEVVMTALGMREDAPPGPPGSAPMGLTKRLASALRSQRLLLVLDNCEHVVEPVAELAAALLRTAPELRILATSREPLGLIGEVVFVVPPLEQSSAVRLFVARAAAAPGFTAASGDAGAVAALCRRLDGIPLALELAASRVRALSVQELVARLDDRFRLLAAGPRGVLPRQRTLRATIDWSWDLLTEPERMVLRRLAVHADGFALQAAESVCAGDGVRAEEVLALLVRLVDRSLVTMASDEGGTRYRLLESVADYCLERLDEAGERDRVRRRHDGYYTEFAERAATHLYGRAQRRWLERLDRETSNIRRALEGPVRDRQPDRALRLVNAMAWYWVLRGRLGEAHRSLNMALAVEGGTDAAAHARALAWRTGIAALVGAVDRQAPPRTAALELCQKIDDPGARARVEWFLGFVECDLGDLSVSEELVNRALRTARAVADRWCIAAALSTRAKQAMLRGDLGEVERSGAQSLELFRALGDRWGQLQSMEWLGALARIRGDYEQATQLHRNGWRMAEELGSWPQVADQLSWLGRIAMHLGDNVQAQDLHERAMRLAARQSYTPGETFAEIGLGLVARREGRLDAAEAHLRSVLKRSRAVGVAPGVAVTLSLVELGFVAEQRGDAAAAQALHLDGLVASRKLGDPRAMALALEGLAGASASAGHQGQAARLLGMADAVRRSAGAPLPPAEQGDVARITAAARTALGEEAFASEFALGANLDPHDPLSWISPAPPRHERLKAVSGLVGERRDIGRNGRRLGPD